MQEYAEMHLVCGFSNGNALVAQREYQDRHPDHQISSLQAFL